MKKFCFILTFLSITLCVWGQPKKTVIVLPSMGIGVDIGIKQAIRDALESGLSQSNQFEVRADLQEYEEIILRELEAIESGLIGDNKQLLKIGNAFGAEMASYAKISVYKQQYSITICLMDMETGLIKNLIGPLSASDELIMKKPEELAKNIAEGCFSSSEKPAVITEMACHAYPNKQIDIYDQGVSDWNTAVKSCEQKGHGWRLPTRDELLVICKDARRNPSSYGTRWQNSTYWTLSKRNNFSVYTVDFLDGSITYESTTSTAYYRCIKEY